MHALRFAARNVDNISVPRFRVGRANRIDHQLGQMNVLAFSHMHGPVDRRLMPRDRQNGCRDSKRYGPADREVFNSG